jgi:hypothetical protein
MGKEINTKETKYLEVPFEVKETKEDEKFFTFEGYASTFGNIDLGNEVCVAGCFEETIKDLKRSATPIKDTNMSSLIPSLWQHDRHEPIGSFISLKEDAKGLFVEGILPKKDTLVSGRVIPQMEVGSIKTMSIGYRVQKYFYNTETNVLDLLKVALREISLITFPMNTLAAITDMKSFEKIKDLSLLTERDFEQLLKSGISMSSKNAKIIATASKNCLLRDEQDDDRDGHDWGEVMSGLNNIKTEIQNA